MAQHNENQFETEICDYLGANGWLYSADDTGYDRERALFPEDIFGWLDETQPSQLAKVVKPDSPSAGKSREQVLDRLVKVLDTDLANGGGTLNVLRKGFKHMSASFEMCQFRPETTLNAATVERYEKVRVRVMRQVHFSPDDQRSVDLVLFVNGIPVATLELKTDFTQTVQDAINQYRTDRLARDPKTKKRQPLFVSGARALVHFAASNSEVWMTTNLADAKSARFLPFNRGTEDGGAGNPVNPDGSPTSYLWERVLERDSWLNILGALMYVKHETHIDPITTKTTRTAVLRFPRFHQWEAVTKITEAVTTEGPGHRYLVQHSAGSGKTDSIAWTAHRMARLQVDNTKVFDSVIVVTDRNVLDAQLQDAIKQIDNKQNIVKAIDNKEAALAGGSKSGALAQALTSGKLIIVVTIQTFPFAMDEIRKNKGLRGKTFAVVADEAHSSQSGQVAGKLKAVLTSEEQEELADGGEVDVQAVLAADAADRADSSNISYFAFTATPKAKTLELFGRPADGSDLPVPFHVYTMRQAIEENYILDVLQGYHSFQLAFKIGQKTGGEVPSEVDQSSASKQVLQWVKLNPQTITQKAGIILDHFSERVAHLLDGHAKAMVVADSRKAAVRYKLAIDKMIEKKGHPYKTLVAFSGTVSDPESWPEEFSEATMNPGVGDLRTAFRGDAYRVMIVANKFQTGFDQPLLCAMYVDRRLSGVTAVQTLSRLNRTYVTPNGTVKTAAMTQVVDFVNPPAVIQDAFAPYYVGAYLETATDPNLVHDLATKLDNAGIYTWDEVEQAAEAMVLGKGNNALTAAITPGKKRFEERYTAAGIAYGGEGDRGALDQLDMFRKDVGSYVRLYDFMSQVIDYGDPALEQRQIYLRLLERVIRPTNYTAPIDLSGIELTNVAQIDRGKLDIGLGDPKGLKGVTDAGSGVPRDPTMVAFQQVLDRLNDLFGDESFTEAQRVSFLEALMRTLMADEAIVQQAQINSPAQFLESPDFDDAVKGAVLSNQDSHNTLAEFFFSSVPGRQALVGDIAHWFQTEVMTGR